MNRQALPSILLSVSIVCFFAVALYRRDAEPRASPGKHGLDSADRGRDASLRQFDRLSGQPGGRDAKEAATASPLDRTGTRVPIRKDGERVAVARAGVPDEPASTGSTRDLAAAAPTVRVTSNRESPPGSSRVPRPRERAAPATETVGRLARAPFTVVGAGETMADVARRVYGTTAEVESLWRANRDIAAAPGSSLTPGTVLRTPAPTLR